MKSENDKMLVQYVLGELPDSERERLEQEYFVNDATWEALKVAEDSLIDDYVKGRLSKQEQRQFENHCLASMRIQKRVEFARFLNDSELRQEASQESGRIVPEKELRQKLRLRWRLIGIAALLLICILLLAQNYRLRVQLEGQKTASGPAPDNAVITSQPDTAGLSITSVQLLPGLLRDGGSRVPPVLRLNSTPSLLRLQLAIQHDNVSQYDAVLETAEGRLVESINGIPGEAAKNQIVLIVPSQLLTRGDYVVRLFAHNSRNQISTYMLSIE